MRGFGVICICLAACGDHVRNVPPHPADQILAVLERGAEALPEPAPAPLPWDSPQLDGESVWDEDGLEVWTWPPPPAGRPAGRLGEFDERVRGFLASPDLREGVQFSCGGRVYLDEEWVEAGLAAQDPVVRLRALAVLVKVRAPRSVPAQWRTLQALREQLREQLIEPAFGPVLARLDREFEPRVLDETLQRAGAWWQLAVGYPTQWAVRAAGVAGHTAAAPRLAEFACSRLLQLSLCAERSLEELARLPGGEEAIDGLVRCVEAWRYDASLRAARALQRLAPERLRSVMLGRVPARFRRHQALLLADLGDARAVPLLCQSVPDTAIIDRRMFDAIERLALPEHRDVVLELPGRVRDEQRQRARQVVAALTACYGW